MKYVGVDEAGHGITTASSIDGRTTSDIIEYVIIVATVSRTETAAAEWHPTAV